LRPTCRGARWTSGGRSGRHDVDRLCDLRLGLRPDRSVAASGNRRLRLRTNTETISVDRPGNRMATAIYQFSTSASVRFAPMRPSWPFIRDHPLRPGGSRLGPSPGRERRTAESLNVACPVATHGPETLGAPPALDPSMFHARPRYSGAERSNIGVLFGRIASDRGGSAAVAGQLVVTSPNGS
jgi:hypothetical protein